jgi:hypothetical protein
MVKEKETLVQELENGILNPSFTWNFSFFCQEQFI